MSTHRSYFRLAKMNERYERAHVLQAREEASYAKRLKRQIDLEREWSKDVPGYVVNQSVYYTKKGERPHIDPTDPRMKRH